MSNSSIGLHQYRLRKKLNKKVEKSPKIKAVFDKAIYALVFISPLLNVPQLLQILTTHSVAGLSLISWIGFSLVSLFWLMYGLIHDEKPIIYTNFALMIIQAAIVIGILVYR